MFRCQRCNKNVGPCIPQNKLVVETRVKVYPEESIGYETVKEISVCNECMKKAIRDKNK